MRYVFLSIDSASKARLWLVAGDKTLLFVLTGGVICRQQRLGKRFTESSTENTEIMESRLFSVLAQQSKGDSYSQYTAVQSEEKDTQELLGHRSSKGAGENGAIPQPKLVCVNVSVKAFAQFCFLQSLKDRLQFFALWRTCETRTKSITKSI